MASEPAKVKSIYHSGKDFWEANPNKALVICDNIEFRIKDAKRLISYIHTQLQVHEIGSEIPIALISSNAFWNLSAILHASITGSLLIPIAPSLSGGQVDNIVNGHKPCVLLITMDAYERFQQWGSEVLANVNTILLPNPEVINDEQESTSFDTKLCSSDIHLPYLLTHTSGSTGAPKAIVFSQQTKLLRAFSAIKAWGLDTADVFLTASGLYHSLGQRHYITAWLCGCTNIVLSSFSASGWINSAFKFKVSFSIPVSSHLYDLCREESFFRLAESRQFKALVSSSSYLSSKLRMRLFWAFGECFFEMYGTSEVGTATITSALDIHHNPQTVGKALPDVDIEIRAIGSQQNVARMNIGEIFVLSPYVCLGYWSGRKLSTVMEKHSYFGTGDLGFLDSDGYLYYSGRAKDSFKVGGIMVYPAEIEEVIMSSGLVILARVIDIEYPRLGSVAVAGIIPIDTSEDVQRLKRQLRALCATKLAGYQVPHELVVFSEPPKLPSGKSDLVTIDHIIRRSLAVSRP